MAKKNIVSAGKLSLFSAVSSLSAKTDTGNAVDGGAGSGQTARQILAGLTPGRQVFAYEPFIGNHRFWNQKSKGIHLRKRALGSYEGDGMLRVSSVVSADSRWGKERGMVGYSSAGSLQKVGEGGSTFGHEVQVVRGDIDLAKDNPIGVVKLDLQGGELNAIYGMREIFSSTVKMAWIEMLANQTQIVELIQELGFYVFDTEYLFRGTPSSEALDYFIQSGSGELSSGSQIWKGIPIMKWVNFAEQIEEYRSRFGLIQTDLLCLKPSFADII